MRSWSLLGILCGSLAALGCSDGGGGGEGGGGGFDDSTVSSGGGSSGGLVTSSTSGGLATSSGSGDSVTSSGAGDPATTSSSGGSVTTTTTSSGAGGDPASTSTSSGGTGPACADDACPFEAGVNIDCRLRFMYGVNYAWRDFGSDFGGQNAWGVKGISGKRNEVLANLRDMRANGVDVVRWWIYPRIYGDQVSIDDQGNPSGLGGTSQQDILAALELAEQAGVNVMFTLFSFDGFHKTSHNPPPNISPVVSLGPIVASDARRAKLIENVVRPVAKAVASSPHQRRMLAWDVINEPEWAMTGPSQYGGDPAFEGDKDKFDLVTHAQMEALVKESVAVLHQETDAPVSVGSAAIKWGQAWTRSGVDFYQVHMYAWVDDWWPYDTPIAEIGPTDKPTVMGEFPINLQDMDVTYEKFVADLYTIGYAGALSWSYTDGNFPWNPNKGKVKAFADQHPCETRY